MFARDRSWPEVDRNAREDAPCVVSSQVGVVLTDLVQEAAVQGVEARREGLERISSRCQCSVA